jgi:hypothetical protein
MSRRHQLILLAQQYTANTNRENIMAKNKIWTTRVEEDPDDPESYIITFPDEVIAEAGWKVGDTLVWDLQENGAIVLTKKE